MSDANVTDRVVRASPQILPAKPNCSHAFGVKIIFLIILSFSLLSCLPKEKENVVQVEIAGRVFNIPEGYFDGMKQKSGPVQGLVLEYSLPDYEPLPRERSERQSLLAEGRMRSMLLEAAEDRPSLDIMISNQDRLGGRLGEFQEEIYGLKKYRVLNWNDGLESHPDDTYLEQDGEEKITSFIRCSYPGSAKIPACSHKFIHGGLLYQTSWNLSNLSEWKEQRAAAIAFTDSLEVK